MTDSDPLPWPNLMAIPTASIGIIPRYLSAALTVVWAAGLYTVCLSGGDSSQVSQVYTQCGSGDSASMTNHMTCRSCRCQMGYAMSATKVICLQSDKNFLPHYV